MDQETLQDCLVEQLRDIYDAEKQLTKALPKMAKAADSEDLVEAIRGHLEETQGQVTRMEQVFQELGIAAKGKPCKAMKGLIEEGGEAISENDKGPVRDIAIIAAAQRVEHYEIAAYGTVRTMAEHLENDRVAELLQETEDEEKAADSKLTEIAMAIYGAEDEGMENLDAQDEEDEDTSAGGRRSVQSAKAQPKAKRAAK
jgi:ferritin-like metal-binding protein YciE